MNIHTEEQIKEAIRLIMRDKEAPGEVPEDNDLKLRIKRKMSNLKLTVKEPIKVFMKMRRSLGGDYMIFDHPLYDIVIMPKKNKLVTFAKKNVSMDTYPLQDKFFDHMMRKGLIEPESVQGGNIYGSLEAKYPINDEVDTIESLLYVIYHFMKAEVKDVKNALDYDQDVEDLYTDPDDEDSTELGEVPQEEKKGAIDPGYKPYGLIYRL